MWEQGFKFVNENDAEWDVDEVSIIPLRDEEEPGAMKVQCHLVLTVLFYFSPENKKENTAGTLFLKSE